MRLEDLKKNLLEMSEEELLTQIRSIRADRVIRKQTKKQKVAKAKTRATAADKVAKLTSGMTPEQLEALFKEFE